MLVDMHIHERTFSPDSFLSMKEIVDIAKFRGLDAICITDHDSMGMKDLVAEYSETLQFPIFVGVEYFSLWGDITAWGIDSFPDHRISAQEFIEQVNTAGGFCVSCHPFRNNNRGLAAHLRDVQGLHGVEVLNGSTDMESNQKALSFARELGLKTIGASDAHWTENVAKYVTWLPERVSNLSDFVAQLHSCQPKPAIWNGSSFDVVDNF